MTIETTRKVFMLISICQQIDAILACEAVPKYLNESSQGR
jgi:hypothetical protein